MKINNLLKSKLSFASIFAAAFVLLLGLFITLPTNAYADDVKPIVAEKQTRTLSVSGSGEVNVAPDIAYISLGVTTQKSTVSDAQSSNTTTMNSLIEAIKNLGIDKSDIKTENYSISPNYSYDSKTNKSTLEGYTVSTTLSITVRDISKAGQVIDTAVQNGANISNGISFGVTNYQKYYNEALANAMANAKNKAQTIADSMDVGISTPVKVAETSSDEPTPRPIFYAANDLDVTASASKSMSVESGTYKISASVSVDYEY